MYNACAYVQGSGIDSEINERGHRQAMQLYNYYKHVEFSAICTSLLKRSQQTVLPFLKEKRATFISTSALNEISWGKLEGLPTTGEVREQILLANYEWSKGNTSYAVPFGESPEQVWQRAKAFLEDIRNKFPRGNVLICTHGRTLRVILSMLLGYGLENMHLFCHYNTGVNILKNEGTLFWAIKLNDISHLDESLKPLS